MNRTEIIRSDDLRAENRYRILRTLRQHGAITRAKVAQQTGLSQASLSTLLGAMIDQGLVSTESESAKATKRGRPTSTVSLNADAAVATTVALTMNQLAICLVDYAGNTLSTHTLELKTQQLTEAQVNKIVIKAISDTLSKNQTSNIIHGISVGYQGITDSAAGDLLWSPIAGFDRLPIANTLAKKFNVPVTVNNDCALIAKALHDTHSDQLGDSFAAVLFSHGVGMGIYLSGKPFAGSKSSALELGHIQYKQGGELCRCGKQGCIEAYAADYGIMRSADDDTSNLKYPHLITEQEMASLVDSANNGNKHAQLAFATAGKAIGVGLATVFTLFDPMPVALVGRNTDAVNLMKSEIQAGLENVGRAPMDYTDFIHSYNDDITLLRGGLAVDAMATLDRRLADDASNTQAGAMNHLSKDEIADV